MKNTLEGINSRLDDTEECIEIQKMKEWKLPKKTKKKKKPDSFKGSLRTTSIILKSVLQSSQKEKGKGQKMWLMKFWL